MCHKLERTSSVPASIAACVDRSDLEAVAGALYKWTNFGKGWRWRWFLLDTRDGSLSYSKFPQSLSRLNPRLRFIGDSGSSTNGSTSIPHYAAHCDLVGRMRPRKKSSAVVHMKISSFRESKSDEKRFYVFTATKTLELRTDSKLDRATWIEALHSTKRSFSRSLNGVVPRFHPIGLTISTTRLRNRLLKEGLSESTVNECEQLVLSEVIAVKENLTINDTSSDDDQSFHDTSENFDSTPIHRREKLPEPIATDKEQRISLWSLIKDNVGKDLTKVCLPVYFNEPISLLQKCFEDVEYSDLLDKAYEYGKTGNGIMRILHVAAFAVSGYASTMGRCFKPFNPLLGETYESEYPERGIRFLAEKVSHHPSIVACQCDGRGWKLWGDSNLCSKFWGQSIQVNPVGMLTLEFADGETFRWSKVTSTIYNIVIGKLHCDHHGTMEIRGSGRYTCSVKFKEASLLERNPHQVSGYVEDDQGQRVASLCGKWDDAVYDGDGRTLWRRVEPPANLTRYNLTAFAVTLNEITAGLREKLPPTDSRFRPDQRFLENGEYGHANEEKQRLEKRQRMARKMQEHGWKPRWFGRDESGTFRYLGGYWEARERGRWDGCPDIFGENCG